jgi:hypothetical protein
VVAAPRTVRLRVPGNGSGRLSTMRFITIVEVMRWTPGKVASSGTAQLKHGTRIDPRSSHER